METKAELQCAPPARTPPDQLRTWNGQLGQRDVPQPLRQRGHPVRAAGRQHVRSAVVPIQEGESKAAVRKQLGHVIDAATAAFLVQVLVDGTVDVDFR